MNWLFFGFIVVGSFLGQFVHIGVFWPVGRETFQFDMESMTAMVVTIFMSNLFLSGFLVITLSGLVFFVLPVAFLCFRGVLWGVMLSGLSSSSFLLALPTLILEGEGYVLAALAGILLGLSWLNPKWLWKTEELSRFESVKKVLKECFYIYVLVAVILFVAAVIEAVTIANMPF